MPCQLTLSADGSPLLLRDADFWMVPPLALLSAESAGAVAGFRGRTLEEAQKQAGLFGCETATPSFAAQWHAGSLSHVCLVLIRSSTGTISLKRKVQPRVMIRSVI